MGGDGQGPARPPSVCATECHVTPHDVLRRLVGGHGGGAAPGHAVVVGRHAQLYDRVAARWVLGGLYRAVAAEVSAVLPSNAAVLDVGTGPGRLLVEVAGRRPDLRLVGVDPSPDMVARARRRARAAGLLGRVEVCVAAAEALPFRADSFDGVMSTLSAHHWADVAAAVTEQSRVLRPSGRLWVFDLRGASAEGVTAGLQAEFGSAQAGRLRTGRVVGVVVARHTATKPPGAPTASPPLT